MIYCIDLRTVCLGCLAVVCTTGSHQPASPSASPSASQPISEPINKAAHHQASPSASQPISQPAALATGPAVLQFVIRCTPSFLNHQTVFNRLFIFFSWFVLGLFQWRNQVNVMIHQIHTSIHSFTCSLVHNAMGNQQPVLGALGNEERIPTVYIFGPRISPQPVAFCQVEF